MTSAPQLTVRAVVTGSVIGFLMAFTNIYIGLKTSFTISIGLTACLVSFSVWQAWTRLGWARTPLGILETNCMQSTASAAGYSTGQGMVAAVGALLLLSVTPAAPEGQPLPWAALAAWVACAALLGTCAAIVLKASMINRGDLPFPTGLAAAALLRTMYKNAGHAAQQTRLLLLAALPAGLLPLLIDLRVRGSAATPPGLVAAESRIFDWLPAVGRDRATGASLPPSSWGMVLDHKLVMIAVGALVGPRVALTMLGAATSLIFVVGPAGLANGAIESPATAWRDIGVWFGASMMVTSALAAFLVGMLRLLRRSSSAANSDAPGDAPTPEVPLGYFVAGMAVFGTALALLSVHQFNLPWPLGLLSVAWAFLLSIAACRVTGESDVTPAGPLAQLTQVGSSLLLPRAPVAALATAGLTAGVATSAADMLTNLRTGRLLGGDPRRQFVAQVIGIAVGTAATVIGVRLLLPDAGAISTHDGRPPAFPAPGSYAWLAVTRALEGGLGSVHPWARTAALAGALGGTLLGLLEQAPARVRAWIPSATGLGLGVLLPFQYPLSMAIGAVGAWAICRTRPERTDAWIVPLASGAIAGESIVGVAVVALNTTLLP